MITDSILSKVIEAAISTGGDYAEVFAENTTANTITMTGGRINQAATGRDAGMSIRVFAGFSQYYGFTTDTSEAGLIALAKEIAASVGEGRAITQTPLLVRGTLTPPNKILLMPTWVNNRAKANALTEAYNAASDNTLCSGVTATYRDIEQHVQIATTDGHIYEETRPYTRITVSLSAASGGQSAMGFEDFTQALGFECLTRTDPADIGREAARKAVESLNAIACPSGEMPMIFAPNAGGTFLHEACGHPLESGYAAKPNTLFYGTIGKQMCNPKVSITDNGLYPDGWGSTAVDDEGVPSQRTVLVENGVVKSFMIDRMGGRLLNMKPTGNGRKQSYRMLPQARMHQLYIEPGNDTFDDMLSAIDTGLYVEEIGGGCANGYTGAFTVAVVMGRLIRNGKLCERVRGATLIGSTLDTMQNLDMVGNDLGKFGGGYCGAESGNLPVGNSTPHIRVKKLRVSGRG